MRNPLFDTPQMDEPQLEQPEQQQEGPGPQLSPLNQYLLNIKKESAKRDPYYGSMVRDNIEVPRTETRKYEDMDYGYMYGVDNEDFYGQRQSWMDKVGNGFLKLAGYTVAKAGAGIGYLGSLANPANWFSEDGYLASAADNAFSEVFENLEDKVRNEWAPTFQEAKDRDKGFWSRAFTDLDFWTEDFVDGVAFLASAYIPGGILAKMGMGAKLAQGLSKLNIGSKAAGAIVPGAETATNYLRQASTIASKLDKGLMWGAATASEAMVEAKGVKDYLTESLRDSEYSEQEKKAIIAGAMQNTFLMNAALLGVTNMMEINYIQKALGKSQSAAKGILQDGSLGTAFTAPGLTKPIGRLDKILNSPVTKFMWSGAKGVAREGYFEENAQLAIQRMNQEYGSAGRVATIMDLDDLGKRYLKQTRAAFLGEDPEASMSIGLGGILGGIPTAIGDARQAKRDRVTTDLAVKSLNLAQDNWLKFGNIYKTEIVETTDAAGNVVKQEKLVLDENKKPVEDIEKVTALASSFRLNAKLLDDAQNESSAFKRNLMRDTAFSQFVGAHIAAGIEDNLMTKLDQALTATPEDVIKMGFDPEYDYKKQIQEYKELASSIIKKNKLVQSDVIFDGSELDINRKRLLTELVSNQSVYEKNASYVLNESKEIADEYLKPPKRVTTDSLVTQLNLLQQRIDSANEALVERKNQTGLNISMQEQFTKTLVEELSKEKAEVEQENELTVKQLNKKKGGYYSYQGRTGRNPMLEMYRAKLKVHGELLNEARLSGLKFAKFADTIQGQKNFEDFTKYIQEEVVDPANKALEKSNRERVNEEKKALVDNIASGRPAKKIKAKYKVNETDDEILEDEIKEGDRYERKSPQGGFNYILTVVQIKPNNEVVMFAKRNDGLEDNVTMKPAEFLSLRDKEKWKKLESLSNIISSTKASTARTPEQKDMGKDNTMEDDDSVDPEITPDDMGLVAAGLRPKWEEVKFNKTFGAHYIGDGNNEVLNTNDGNDRFYRFTSKYSLLGGRYGLMVVTEDNDVYKLRNTKANPKDIKVVVVKWTSDTNFEYVDENNEIIPSDEAGKSNLVYSSLADISNWSVQRVRDKYTVSDKTTDEEIQSDIDKHREFQEYLRKEVRDNPGQEIFLDVWKVSPGVRNVQRNMDGTWAMNPVEGRLVVSNPDWSDLRSVSDPEMNISLRVSTDKSKVMGIKPGRAFMQEYKVITSIDGKQRPIWSDKVTQVFTREMNAEEKQNYFQAVVRMTELMNKKYGVVAVKKSFWKKKKQDPKKYITRPKTLTNAEKEEMDLLQNWLKGVVVWSEPGPKQSVSRHIWVKNGLHVGSEKIEPPLTNKALENKKNVILKSAFYNINRTMLSKNDPFIDVKMVNGKATEGVKYSTYQQFLLDARDNGQAPPVYSSLSLYDSNIPHRKSAFIIWNDPNSVKETEDEAPQTPTTPEDIEKIALSKLDKNINDFVNGKSARLIIEPRKGKKGKLKLSLEREVLSDGKIRMLIIKGEGKTAKKDKVDLNDMDEFLRQKDRTLKNIATITGYIPGSSTKFVSLEEKMGALMSVNMSESTIRNLFQELLDGKPLAEFTDHERAVLSDPKNKHKYRNLQPGNNPFSYTDQQEQEDEEEDDFVVSVNEGDVFEDRDGNQFVITNDTNIEGTDTVEYVNKDDETDEGAWSFDDFVDLVQKGELVNVNEKKQARPKPSKPAAPKKVVPQGRSNVKATTIPEAIDNAFVENGHIVAELYMYNVNDGKKVLQSRVAVPGTQLTPQVKNQLRAGFINNVDDVDYRLALSEEVKKTEDFNKLQAFMNANLPQVTVNRMNHLINGKAWGAFMNGAIYIYEKAEYGTGFHEAFEAVWKTYLTDQEQADLIAEFRQREGTFFNPYSQQTKSYSEASEWDVKEMLADEFKDYVINNGRVSKQVKEKTKSIFQKLWNFIRGIFNLPPAVSEELESSINNVFKKITSGGFRNIEPIVEKNVVGTEYAVKVDGFSQKETSEVVEGLTHYFFTELFKNGGNIDTLLNNMSKKDSNQFFINLYQQAYNNVNRNLEMYDAGKATLFRKHGMSDGEIYRRFKKRLEKYGVKFSEVEQKGDENTKAERNPLGIVDSISVNPRKMTEVNVQILLSTLPSTSYDANRKVYISDTTEMFMPKLVDSDQVHNMLLNELSNITGTFDENGRQNGVFKKMMDKLDQKYRSENGTYKPGYEWIRNLKLRLKYADKDGNVYTYEDGTLDTTNMTEDDVKLRIAFTKSFTNVQFVPTKLIIGQDGRIYSISPLMNTNQKRIRDTWANNLKLNIQNDKDTFFKISRNGTMVFDKTGDTFVRLKARRDSGRMTLDLALDILSAIGIEFTATLEQLSKPIPGLGISPEETIKENASAIFNLIEGGKVEKIENIYATDKVGVATDRINLLVAIEGEYNSEDNILSYLNGEGEMQFAVGIPSLYGNMVNIINSVKSLKELVYTCPWLGTVVTETVNGKMVEKVQLHPYQTNAELLKPGGTLFDEKGRRNSNMLRYNVLVGTGVSDVEGVNTAKLQYPERVSLKINYMTNYNGPIGFTVINSDKNSEFGLGLPVKNSVTLDITNFRDVAKLMNNTGALKNTDAAIKTRNKATEKILIKYKLHLTDEMLAAKAYVEETDAPNIKHYMNEVVNLGHFKDILTPELHEAFKKEVLMLEEETEFGDIQEFMSKYDQEISDAIIKHVLDQAQKTKELLLQNDIFSQIPDIAESGYITDAVDNERLSQVLMVDPATQNVEIDEKSSDGKWVDSKLRMYITPEQLDAFAAYLAVNEELITTEQHKLVFGHPALFDDLAKRASGATGNKQSIVEDQEVLSWLDDNYPRMDGKVRMDETHQTFKVVSFKDVDVASLFYKQTAEVQYADYLYNGLTKKKAEELMGARFDEQGNLTGFILDKKGKYTGNIKAYMSLNEADGMAFIMPDFARDMFYLSSKFDNKMREQWDYEMAYERLVRGGMLEGADGKKIKPTNPSYLPIVDAEQYRIDVEVVKKGDPGYPIPVQKPQYFGYAATEGMTHTVFLKHAVQVKFYRHVEGTQFESIYIAAQNNQTDVVGFESGEKVGNVTLENGGYLPIYNERGAPNVLKTTMEIGVGNGVKTFDSYDLPEELPRQSLYTKFYGIQVEQASKTKRYTVRGSQVTKVVQTNFFENGKPITDQSGKPIKEIGDTIKDFNDTLISMIRLGKETLLKELGLEKAGKNYKVKDLSKLVNMLKSEAEERELPDNVIEAIAVLEDGSLLYEFDTLINREKIDNILNSIVDSRVISEKLHGKSSVQVASTLYEFGNRKYIRLNDDGTYEDVADPTVLEESERSKVRMASSDLKFYRNENGTIKGMEVYIGWPFNEVTPEQLGLKMVNGIYRIPENGIKQLNAKLLELVGFRIPTQGPNAIEAITVKGFTPASNGDMIVVPSEIVGKAGSDFDIDKLYLYMPNYEVFIGEKAFGTKEFKDFMAKDLLDRGMKSSDVKILMNLLKKEDYELINKAAFDNEDMERYNVQYSLEVLPKRFNDITRNDREFIKKSIMAYKKEYKGYKELQYVTPDDTTRKGLQNKFIELNRKLILHPANAAQLVVPNSTATLKQLATEIRTRKEIADKDKVKPNEKSPTFLRSFVGSLNTRERYILAKRMVGISALHTTFHTMAQISGLRINGDRDYAPVYLIPRSNDSKDKNAQIAPDSIDIKLDHHPKNPDGTFNIGHRFDTDKIRISDAFSEATSGFVDGAKDPFVFDLNFSLDTAGVWFYLKHLGVPEDQIAYLLNQPILDDYFREMAKNKSSFKKVNDQNLSKEDVFLNVVAPYYEKVRGQSVVALINSPDAKLRYIHRQRLVRDVDFIYKNSGKFSLQQLKDNIIKGHLSNSSSREFDPNFQIAVLASYLRYEAQSRKVGEFIQAITYDTQATKTIQENRYQEASWNKIEQDSIIANPQAIMENTFLGEMKYQKEEITPMFRNFFITLDPEIQKVFQPLYDRLDNPDYFITKDEAVLVLNRYQNHVLNYILHTTKFKDSDRQEKVLNEMYADMFLGDNTMAQRLYELKMSDNPEIADNLFIKEMLPVVNTDVNAPSNISMFRNRLDTYDINNIIESLDNLHDYAKKTRDKELMTFIGDMAKFVILQSGVGTSSIDFKKGLSVDTYTNLVKTIFDTFKSSKVKLDTKQVWRTFHQNNATNRMIVSKSPKWVEYKDKSLRINPNSSLSLEDYYVKYLPTVSKEKLTTMMRSNKSTKDVYKPVLFERTNITDEDGMLIYYPLDTLGDGRNAVEIYTDPEKSSVFAKNDYGNVINTKGSSADGYSRVLMSDTGINMSREKKESKYLGGKGGYDATGRGTALGDGKDKALRSDADSIIVELEDTKLFENGESEWDIAANEMGNDTSHTSLWRVARKNKGVIEKDRHTHQSIAENPKVVMLSRSTERGRYDLTSYTKQAIKQLNEKDVTFILGDTPKTDDAFVKYLEEIGAKYNIYYAGDENRLQKVIDKFDEKKPKLASKYSSLEEMMGKMGANTSSSNELTYENYLIEFKQSNAKSKTKDAPISKQMFEKMSERQKKHLFAQKKTC